MTKTSPAPFKPSWFRKTFSYGLIGIGCFSILVLDRTDIVMNATHSLHEPAFLMVDTPILLTRGSVVASEMPEVLKETALIEAGFIPEGHYALFGTEPDSLDSRYYPTLEHQWVHGTLYAMNFLFVDGSVRFLHMDDTVNPGTRWYTTNIETDNGMWDCQ